MGIVTPPRGSKAAAPFSQKAGAGSSATGGVAAPLRSPGRGAPRPAQPKGSAYPGYGSNGGGPALPPQSPTKSGGALR